MPNGGGGSTSSSQTVAVANGRAASLAATQRREERRAAYVRRMASIARQPGMALAEVAEGMHVRHLRVPPPDVVFVKGIVEASEGLGAVFAEAGGDLAIAVPRGREGDLARLLEDLAREIDLQLEVSAHA